MEELVELRHYLHSHPEISQHEQKTQEYLYELLKKLQPDKLTRLAETGLLVIFYGKEKGKNLLFRADIDALPIQEAIDLPYASGHQGWSHKCGHDGHTTIMYGVAKRFAAHRPAQGNLYLIFQPAEENGWGARAVIDSKELDRLDITNVVALHNLPGYPLHQVVCKTGSFTSSVTTMIADFRGYTSHAAEPWNGRNPAKAMSMYTIKALELNEEKGDGKYYVTVTPAYTVLGEKAYGISAGEGSVHLTIRADNKEKLDAVLEKIKNYAIEIVKDEELDVSFSFAEPFDANQNDPSVVSAVKSSAEALQLDYKNIDKPFRWGEDFGLFTQIYPGAMFGIGSGENCKPLHHPAYNFPDELIETGVNMFVQLQKTLQES